MGIFDINLNIFLSKIVIICQYGYTHIMGVYLLIKVRGNEEFIKAILFIVTIECSGIC